MLRLETQRREGEKGCVCTLSMSEVDYRNPIFVKAEVGRIPGVFESAHLVLLELQEGSTGSPPHSEGGPRETQGFRPAVEHKAPKDFSVGSCSRF